MEAESLGSSARGCRDGYDQNTRLRAAGVEQIVDGGKEAPTDTPGRERGAGQGARGSVGMGVQKKADDQGTCTLGRVCLRVAGGETQRDTLSQDSKFNSGLRGFQTLIS